MKQKNYLLKLWMLLLCVVAGVGNVWGDTVTYTVTSKTAVSTSGTAPEGSSATYAQTYSTACQATSGNSFTLTLSKYEGYIIKGITLSMKSNASKGAGNLSVVAGSETIASIANANFNTASWYGSWSTTYVDVEVSMTNESYTIKKDENVLITINATANSLYCQSYTLTYESAGGGGSDPSISLSSNSIEATEAAKEGTINVTYNNLTDYAADVIFYESDGTTEATYNHSWLTAVINSTTKNLDYSITANTGAARTAYLRVSAEGNEGEVESDLITITQAGAPPSHTVTFSINGTTTTQDFVEGATITFPENPADIEGKVFVGWVTTAITGITDTAPEFVTSATMGENDVTYYAVFALASQGGVTSIVDNLTNELTGVTSNNYTEWSGKTSSSDAVYGGQSTRSKDGYIQLRTNNSNSGIVTTASGGKLKKVSITWGSGNTNTRSLQVYGKNSAYSNATDLYKSSTQGTLLGSLVVNGTTELNIAGDYTYVGLRSADGALYISQIDITWESGAGVSFSDYCTTVVAAAVERPVITVADNPFYFSTTATITCATEGATIKYSYDGENWSDYTSALTITETKTIYAKAVKGNDESAVAQVTATKNLAETTVTVSGELTLDLNGETNVSAGTLTAAVTYNESSVDGATVTWSSSDNNIATIDPSTGAVTLVATGEVTFTATYAGSSDYAEATGSKTITVIDSKAPGTEQNPYTVAEAIAATPSSGNSKTVYIRGIVSQFYNTSIVGDGSNYRYYISDDGTTTSQLLVYRGKGLNNVAFSSADDLQLGDIVVIAGQLTTYSNNPEIASGNYIVSLQRTEKPATPTFSPEAGTYTSVQTVEISCKTEGATIYYTTDGTEPTAQSTPFTEPITVNADMTIKAIAVKDDMSSDVATAAYTIDFTPSIVFDGQQNPKNVPYETGSTNIHYVASNITGSTTLVLCDANGEETTYDWFSAELYGETYVRIAWQDNDGEARTAYFKLVADDTESPIFAVTQAEFVVDYATLPFTFDGGSNDISETMGLTQEGLSNDYGSSPKLKFDGTGDYLILKINERPGTLTFNIKGNSFSGGTFTVQTSEDGETYTDLANYTVLGETQNESFNNLGENVRYIKWIYTEKSSGNVALGNIALTKYEEQVIEPSITVAPTSVEAPVAGADGTLTVTYTDIDTDLVEIQWVEADGTTETTYGWVTAEFDNNKKIEYIIEANTGEARTAYLKIYGLDTTGNDVYSNLVTITQAAQSAPVTTVDWTLTDLADITEDDVFVIVGDNGSTYAMGNDNGTSAPAAVAVTIENDKLSKEPAANIQWNLNDNGTDGYTFYPNGDDETWLYCTNSNNGVKVGTGDANIFTIDKGYLYNSGQRRYVGVYNSQDWRCYTNTTGNIADQSFSFYKKESLTITLAASGYASYCSDKALDFSNKVKSYGAWYVSNVSGTTVTFTEITGAVPAGTPIILYSNGKKGQSINIPYATGETTALQGNMLRGTLEETHVDAVEGDYTNFGLSNGKFVRMKSGTVRANKAFLPILTASLPSDPNARLSIVFSEETDGIKSIENGKLTIDNSVYDLQGRRVETMKKGSLYIVNGKKVVF